jgi:hypothetical protein
VKRPLIALPLALPFAVLALAGCGSSDAGGNVDKSDPPAAALSCLESKQIPARQTGENGNELVLDAGPKIKFYLTADAAIAEQFSGHGEGAEQIGAALLFVQPETSAKQDDLLHEVEICLANL